jgi:putative transposase
MTTRRRKKHRPEEAVAKLRDADAMPSAGKYMAAVLQPWFFRDFSGRVAAA